MNRKLIASALIAAATMASAAAFAGEANYDEQQQQVASTRTRAEVKAEAATVAQTRSLEPAGSRVLVVNSTNDRAAVRAQAAEAVRLGQIPHGEAGLI